LSTALTGVYLSGLAVLLALAVYQLIRVLRDDKEVL
jgi:hypothetical protein